MCLNETYRLFSGRVDKRCLTQCLLISWFSNVGFVFFFFFLNHEVTTDVEEISYVES